jgi:hypothetical protein
MGDSSCVAIGARGRTRTLTLPSPDPAQPAGQAGEAKTMSTTRDRPRIFSHLTKSRFLHIEDSLERGKLRFFIGSFERGQGAVEMAFAFMDVEDARVVLSDLSWGKAVDFVDFKGGRDDNQVIMSRVLKITTNENKVWVELQNGAGEELSGGGVKPKGKATVDISIPLTIFEGRKLAHACLAYIHAWDVQKQIAAVSSDPARTRVITDW